MKLALRLAGYPRLLLAGSPSRVDLCMLLAGVLSAVAAGIPFPLIGILFGQLLDDFNSATCDSPDTAGSGPQYQHSIDGKILIIVYLAIAQFVTIYVHLTCWTLTGARLAQRLRESYLQNLLRQEPSYFDRLPSGAVASRLNGDIQAIRSGTSEKVGVCLSSFSFFITAYIVAFIKDSTLAAMLLSLIPAYFLMSLVGSHHIEKYSSLVSDYAAAASSIASEALSNIVVVQAFGANARLEDRFAKLLGDSRRQGLKKATAVGIQSGFLYFIAYSANGLAFWQGSRRIADAVRHNSGGATVGSTFTVIFILVEATLVFSQVTPFIHLFTAAVASYENLRANIERDPSIDGTSTSVGSCLPSVDGTFEFRNASFIYPSRPEVTVLDKINLRIPAKKHTAIVGLSGSGKSTIAGLLTRLYDPTEGEVLLDGRNLRDLNTRHLRSLVSLVQQEPSLLNRSLLENIAHGLINSSKPEHEDLKKTILSANLESMASELRSGKSFETVAENSGSHARQILALVREAAALADADSFISTLQHGYGTVVGSGGRLISGGQKQRVSLARALIKDPPILILDEAMASLDARSERRIQAAVSMVAKDRTIVTIAHRLSTISGADNIIVMDRGHVVEEGAHSELIRKGGAYADLVKLQALNSTSETGISTSSTDIVAQFGRVSPAGTDIEEGTPVHGMPGNDETRLEKGELSVPSDAAEVKEPETPPHSLWSLMKGYSPLVRPYLLIIAISLFGSSVVGGAFSAEAVIFGNTVGSLSPCKTAESIQGRGSFYGLMFLVLAIIEFFGNFVSWSGFGWVAENVVYTVRVASFRSLMEQDLHWHQSNGRSPPLLLSYITNDGNALAGLSGSVIGTLFSITVNLIAAIILTHLIAWRIALVCLSLVPLLLGAGLMELRILGKFEERHESAYTKSVDIGVEAISSIKTIASLSLEEETLKTYQRSLKGPRKEIMSVTIQASLWQAMTYFLGNLVNALAYWWGAKQIIAGNYTQTQFLIVVFSLLVSALLWSQMFLFAPELSSARASMARILSLLQVGSRGVRGQAHLLDPPSKQNDIEAALESKASYSSNTQASSIQFRDVHFSYPARPNTEVLRGLDLSIEPGQFCALFGPSGAGKSTIISLVERLYTPQTGSILIDGVDVARQQDVTFRHNIALVPQESVLFEGSIEFNIGLGAKPGHEVSMDEIKEACRLANIHDTIEGLPDGYNTLCGPNGSQFSGGQKQRLSIARALVRKPKLLILDESTSALDAESEKLLQDGLDKAAKGITVIAIAHRLNTIRKADVIFVIEGGQCTDRGSHDELLHRSESYRLSVAHQKVAE